MDERTHKHKFKFKGVEDFFLYKQLHWVCEGCFVACYSEQKEFYAVLIGEPLGSDRPYPWR